MNKLATNGVDVHFFTHSLTLPSPIETDNFSSDKKAFIHFAFVVASGSLDVRHLGRIAIVFPSRRYFVHLLLSLPLALRYTVLCCSIAVALHC